MSMGWLAQSSLQPKKRKEIEGVSSNAIVGLKAALYKAQAEPRVRGAPVVSQKKSSFNVKNKGLAERNARDLAVEESFSEEAGRARLLAKCELYEQRAHQRGMTDDSEVCLVDFERKQWDNVTAAGGSVGLDCLDPNSELFSGDMQRDYERRQWEAQELAAAQHETLAAETKRKEILALEELSGHTHDERSRQQQLKQQREIAAQKRQQMLKAKAQQRVSQSASVTVPAEVTSVSTSTTTSTKRLRL